MAEDVKKIKKMKRTVYLSDAAFQLLSLEAILNYRSISDQLEFTLLELFKKKLPQNALPQIEKDEPLQSSQQVEQLQNP